jgi:hypothetical protein
MEPFEIQDNAMTRSGHQVGTNTPAKRMPLRLLQRNVAILAKCAKGSGLPLTPELEAFAPSGFAARIQRKGLVNAWEDEDFAMARRRMEGPGGGGG